MGLYLSKKLVLTLLVLANMAFVFAQDSTLLQRQAAHKSKEYLSFDIQALLSTNTQITRTTDRDVMSKLVTP